MTRYDHKVIEKKWQGRWIKEKIYEPDLRLAKKPLDSLDSTRDKSVRGKPFYNLMMFPYPSAEGLHVGNMYAFTGSDIYGRFKRMQGYDVFEPIGLDGFGIHSENYALKTGRHPAEQAKISEKNFYRQLQMIGNSFAWNEKLETYDPAYYKWTQWIFTQMFKRGWAYRKKAAVNWCPSCKTVLADEQVLQKSQIPNPKSQISSKLQVPSSKRIVSAGVCERCGMAVITKELEQWFFRITKYAERLLGNLEKIDWSEKIKIAQKNWIGKSEGATIKFSIFNFQFSIEVFTTRPDTLFGATYVVLAPEHELISNLKSQISNLKTVEEYIKKSGTKSEEDRIAEGREKTGVELKGVKAINPANGEEIPVWVADYVLGHVGTGAIMAVPAHDSRDFEFAKKYKLPIKIVICPHYPSPTCPILDEAYTGEGRLVDSGKFSGMKSEEAKWEITKFVGGERKTQYRLRDWLISRQRYWGPPIPLVFCENCAEKIKSQKSNLKNKEEFNLGELENPGWVAVKEKNLPVKLPFIKNFRPTGTNKSPLAADEKFYKVRCPKCKSWARRETDVSDTFLDSAWYYIGYLAKSQISNLKSQILPFSNPLNKKWLPVDMYIGGAEHAVLHLLYVRFLTMALHDIGVLDFSDKNGEPFKKFRAHGLIIKDGAKMSKSKGNVVNPDEYIRAYGADALRMYLMFIGPFDQGGDFRDSGIKGITRFLDRTYKLISNYQFLISKKFPISNSQIPNKSQIQKILHQTIKKVTEDIENLQYNTAISALMILLNEFEKNPEVVGAKDVKTFLKLLAPFAPHLTEELWQTFSGAKKFSSIHRANWPKYDPRLLASEAFDLIIQINGKFRGKIRMKTGTSEAEAKKTALDIPGIKKHLSAASPKIIFVPDKLINFVS